MLFLDNVHQESKVNADEDNIVVKTLGTSLGEEGRVAAEEVTRRGGPFVSTIIPQLMLRSTDAFGYVIFHRVALDLSEAS